MRLQVGGGYCTETVALIVGALSFVLVCFGGIGVKIVSASDEPATLRLSVEGDRITANIKDAPMIEVARSLQNQSDIRIFFHSSVVQTWAVTAAMNSLPARDALRRILEGINYTIIVNRASRDLELRLYGVQVDGNGGSVSFNHAGSDAPYLTQANQDADEVEEQADVPTPVEDDHANPTSRAHELESAVVFHGSQSLPIVLAAANDHDAIVRAAAERFLLADLRDVVPQHALSMIALTSKQPDRRKQALEVLAEGLDTAHARMTLDAALQDPDPGVKELAASLLLELPVAERE